MNKIALLALALALPLSACNTESQTEEAGEAGANVLEAKADSVEDVTDEGTAAQEQMGEMTADSLRDEADAMENVGEATDPTGNINATQDAQ